MATPVGRGVLQRGVERGAESAGVTQSCVWRVFLPGCVYFGGPKLGMRSFVGVLATMPTDGHSAVVPAKATVHTGCGCSATAEVVAETVGSAGRPVNDHRPSSSCDAVHVAKQSSVAWQQLIAVTARAVLAF